MSRPRVAILGVGIMGGGMASQLLSAGFPLVVYNRNRERAQPLVDAGAVLASSPREAAARSEITLSMVADDAASRGVWFGDNGALAGTSPGALLVECSTLAVPWIKELAAAAAAQGCDFLDAPVTGTKSHAAAGDLLFLVGGSEKALAAALPVFSVLGRDTIHLGPTGSGTVMKLINNFMAGVQAASLAEATAFIHAGGLDLDQALQVLTAGAPGSPMIKLMTARANSGDFTPNFLLRLMAKDLAYASEEGTRHGVNLQTAKAAHAVFQNAVAAGYGEQDLSAVIESLSPGAPSKKLRSA
jgi:3-hydroxyisobutyrate dehydrogenase